MISERDGQLYVAGEMNQQTAPELFPSGCALLEQESRVINLSGISAVDSSALAILLGWLRAARTAGNSLTIVEAPPAFLSLSDLYDLTPILFPDSGNASSAQH